MRVRRIARELDQLYCTAAKHLYHVRKPHAPLIRCLAALLSNCSGDRQNSLTIVVREAAPHESNGQKVTVESQ